MARNDIVLIDSIVAKAKVQLGLHKDDSEIFELFCFDQVLKDFDLSFEEIKSCWTDGTNDGGIDGFFVFIDGHLVIDDDLSFALRRNLEVNVELFTVKRSDSFKQEPLNSIYSSIVELLDLTKADNEFSYPFNAEVLRQRKLLRQTIISVADRRPRLRVRVHYCCRGDLSTLSDNLTSRATLIRDVVSDLFSEARVEVNFIGASELLTMARRQQAYSLRLKFIESYISREGGNYIVLASLPSYFSFITDEEGNLRRYLFESNVRDYLGTVQVNQDIRSTLDTKKNASEEDFWWVNNGVTILATHANVVGKEISIENVQIVNGLQTTETIYEFYSDNMFLEDNRAILIKVLLAGDEKTRDRIIKATNYQNSVELSSLRGLDTIQRDIEHFLFDNGWYYDRKKNYYKNQGRPAERIISIGYLAAAVRAVALGDPVRSQRQRSRSLKDDKAYRQVFNTKWDLEVYLASLEITHAVEYVVQGLRTSTEVPPIAIVHFISYIFTCDKLGTSNYTPADIATLAGAPPTSSEVTSIIEDLKMASTDKGFPGRRYAGIKLNRPFIEDFILKRYSESAVKSTATSSSDYQSSLPSTGEMHLSSILLQIPQNAEDVIAAFEQLKEFSTPVERTIGAYSIMLMTSRLLSLKARSRYGMRRTIINVARERGVAKEDIEYPLAIIHSYYNRMNGGDKEFTEEDARRCLSALAKILEYVGLKAVS